MKVAYYVFLSHELVPLHFFRLDLHARVIEVVLIKISCGVFRITSFLYS